MHFLSPVVTCCVSLQVADSDTEGEGEESDDSNVDTSCDSDGGKSPQPSPPSLPAACCPGEDGQLPKAAMNEGGCSDSDSQSEGSDKPADLDELSLENRLHLPHRDQQGDSPCSSPSSMGGAPLDTQLMQQQVRQEVLRRRHRQQRPRVKLQGTSAKGKRSAKGNRQAVKAAMSSHF